MDGVVVANKWMGGWKDGWIDELKKLKGRTKIALYATANSKTAKQQNNKTTKQPNKPIKNQFQVVQFKLTDSAIHGSFRFGFSYESSDYTPAKVGTKLNLASVRSAQ